MIYPSDDFFKEEVRDNFLVTEEIKKTWAVQIELVQKLLEICNKNNLKCWADSGTLIGIIRDKGFIPWDNDIDMVMMREDYDKLLKIAPFELEDPYFLQTCYSDLNYRRKFARICKSGTAAIFDAKNKERQCIFVDIFVQDALPKDLSMMGKHILKIKIYKEICNLYSCISKKLPNSWSVKNSLKAKLYNNFDKILRKYDTKSSCFIASLSLSVHSYIKHLKYYRETLYKDFEYIKLPVPAGYDDLLHICYGDYMTPVDYSKRDGIVFDTENDEKIVKKRILSSIK